MNRVLATALEFLNYIIVGVIIGVGGYAGWFFSRGDPEAQGLFIATGVFLGILIAALVGGAMSLVVLMESHLRTIRTNAVRQTELLEKIAAMAEADVQAGGHLPDDGGFGSTPAWARTGGRS